MADAKNKNCEASCGDMPTASAADTLFATVLYDDVQNHLQWGQVGAGHLIADPSTTQSYVAAVWARFEGVESTLERMRHATTLLSWHADAEKAPSHPGLSRSEWVHYHYAVYCMCCVTTYDCMLLLINQVLKLGLPDESCRNDTIVNNEHVKKASARPPLLALQKVVTDYRRTRNTIAHRAMRPKLPIDALEWLRGYAATAETFGHDPFGDGGVASGLGYLDPEALEAKFMAELNNLVTSMRESTDKTVTAVTAVLDACVASYRERVGTSSPCPSDV